MADYEDTPADRLWREYGKAFRDFDDLSLARWLAQTLSQLQGRVWRASHPLVATYRLAAQLAHERQIWLKRLVTVPASYADAPCCRAPLLPLLTRDITETGLVCQHCGETCVPWEEIPGELVPEIQEWSDEYRPVHAVAHWDDSERKSRGKYEQRIDDAAKQAEQLLAIAGHKLAPKLLDHFPAVIWEDEDECLEVRPEDIEV